MAAAEGLLDEAACDLCGLTSVLFFRAPEFLFEFVVIALPAEACLKAYPAGDGSREERGEVAVEGDREE